MDKKDSIRLAYRTEGYANKVKQLFDEAVKELLAIAKESKSKPYSTTFSFSETKRMEKRTEAALRKLHAATTAAIKQGIRLEWEEADKATDKMLATLFGQEALKNPKFSAMVKRNETAMDAFINRSDKGIGLSERIWKYTRQLRDEMEAAIAVSIGEGESADNISRRVRQYLNEPDKLFRRVRGADGKLRLSKAAKAYHPGRGVYRSSYKNAMRVARTETNIAYRTEDSNRVSQLDFVLGIRISLSKMHPEEDICDELKGDYPSDFMFTGWHPQCFCYTTTILPSDEELKRYNKALLRGEKYEIQGKIKDVPKVFKDWVSDNKDNIENAAEGGKLPYFLRDNRKYWDVEEEVAMIPNPYVKTTYTDNSDINDTMNGINNGLTDRKWFNNGDCDIQKETDKKNNGSTNGKGKIWLQEERIENVKSALAKIGSGKPEEITEEEADAMATLWHETTHNRHIKIESAGSRESLSRKYMELANEYVARKTLPEFYGKLGCLTTPQPQFIENRNSTAYNGMVLKYDYVVKTLALDENKVLESMMKGLFEEDYKKQKDTIIQALIDGGIKKNDGSTIKKSELASIVQLCQNDFADISEVKNKLQKLGFL